MSYNISKLKRSLAPRVRDRLVELLPGAEVALDGDRIAIRMEGLDGSIDALAVAEACVREDRSMWGPIAGSFCNLVKSRVDAHFLPSFDDQEVLSRVFPTVQPDLPEQDKLVRGATPVPDLIVASQPWLDGLRVEFDYADVEAGRRVFKRDLAGLGIDAATVAEQAIKNMKAVIPNLTLAPLDEAVMGGRVLTVQEEGLAPAMLRAPDGHTAMIEAMQEASGGIVKKLLACAPRSDMVTFCDIRDRSAASFMVSRAWELHETPAEGCVPLSPRLFTIAGAGNVRYLDVGIGDDRVADWTRHTLAEASFRVPEGWLVSEQGDRWVIWMGDEGPRVRVRIVEAGGGSAHAASQLAAKVRAKHAIGVDVGYGFFNGLPWAWVDTGMHDGFSTASMFAVLPTRIVILQTEVPENTPQGNAVALQKIMATIQPAPAAG